MKTYKLKSKPVEVLVVSQKQMEIGQTNKKRKRRIDILIDQYIYIYTELKRLKIGQHNGCTDNNV